MSAHPSVKTLERTRQAYRANSFREALALAEAGHRMLEQIPGAPPDTAGLVTSWYGFLVGTVGGRPGDGLDICREALRTSMWEPRIYEHVARLEMMAGSRRRALEAIEQGLSLAEHDRELRDLRASLGRRRRPPLRFLDRSHPINVALGRVLHRIEAASANS